MVGQWSGSYSGIIWLALQQFLSVGIMRLYVSEGVENERYVHLIVFVLLKAERVAP